MKNKATDYQETKIWKHFEKEVTDTNNKQTVEYLVGYAIPILKEINETFPTYTLHDGQHQLNILNLYADLLGERISELSGLETAILILSAFYHDIGMVYTKQERDNLSDEPLFNDFLKAKPAARLELDKKKKVDDELAEWYCRWAYAKRVWVYLNKLDKKIIWDKNNSIGNNFRVELAEVCLSHCEDTDYIKMSDEIVSDYWNDADLKFCAILLRLADILDFDNTRSPVSLYKHLGLDKPKTNSEKISQQEWRKHIASIGFDFRDWSRDNQYILYYKATPDHPAVENDIYEFLNVIEDEIQQCRMALNSCSDKWRNFVLPGKIDRKQVRSQGYTSGAFKFSLDQNQILQLLMGESLYDNPYVFIRELVQNAIDTSRHRVKHEKNVLKNDTFTSKPIEFTDWEDEDGYRWIRIDDYGMGMTKDQIEKYFLKVGNSFYNSDDFKISKLDYSAEDKNFTPISRFGIGILSCFMVADKIEVSTKSVYCGNDRDNPIRLSLRLYRKETGTSIAIRLKHNFNRDFFSIDKALEKHVYASEISIVYESNYYGNQKIDDFTKVKIFKLHQNEIAKIKEFLKVKEFPKDPDLNDIKSVIHIGPIILKHEIEPEIHRVPIILKHEKIPNIEGILFIFLFKNYITLDNYGERIIYKNENYKNEPALSLEIGHFIDDDRFDINVSRCLDSLVEFNQVKEYSESRNEILLSHNGIIVPMDAIILCNETNSKATTCLGILNLKDELRPKLNAARNEIKSFSWKFYSQLNFLIAKSLLNSKYNFEFKIDYIEDELRIPYANYENDLSYISDNLLLDLDGWQDELVAPICDTKLSLIQEGKVETEFFGRDFRYGEINKFSSGNLFRIVLFNNFHYSIKLFKKRDKEKQYSLCEKAFIKRRSDYYRGLFPLYLTCEYENFSGLIPEGLDNSYLYNINHNFTLWLRDSYSELITNFGFHLQSILETESIEDLNSTLNKLKKILPEELKPNFTITEKDFEVDYDLLDELPENED